MILLVIPAKDGSTRLPGKNMLNLNGRPMLDYTVDAARRSKRVDRIVVSTDSDEIAAHAESLDVEVVRRSTDLGGEVPLFDVYKHAADQVGIDSVDLLVGLQVDHPDRNVSVDEAIEWFEAQEGADYLTTSEADGTVNGSYKIYTNAMLLKNEAVRHVVLVDDCTNIHYEADLKRAEAVLKERQKG